MTQGQTKFRPLSEVIPFREYAVILLLFFSYWSLAGISGQDKVDLIHIVTKENKSDLLIWLDDKILGFQPSQALEAYLTLPLVYLMSFAYIIAYIPLFLYTVYTLHSRKRFYELEHLLTAFVVAYTIALPIFFIVPAPEPRYVLNYSNSIIDSGEGVIQKLDDIVVNLNSTQMNSLPSLHVALSTLVLLSSMSLKRHERLVVCVFVLSLWFSTLYLRHHYFVDIIGGWLLAVFSWRMSKKLFPLPNHD
ncbi:MAG: phosphatase PAP2 family protein [Candidatus Altiarchaeota archaeon]